MTRVTLEPASLDRLTAAQRATAAARLDATQGPGLRAAFGADLSGTALVLCRAAGQACAPLLDAMSQMTAPLLLVTPPSMAAPTAAQMVEALALELLALCPAATRWLVAGTGSAGADALQLAGRLPASLGLAVLPHAKPAASPLAALSVPQALASLAPPVAARLFALEAGPWMDPADWPSFAVLPPIGRIPVPGASHRALSTDPARLAEVIRALQTLPDWSTATLTAELTARVATRIEDIEAELAPQGAAGHRLSRDRVIAIMHGLVPLAPTTPPARIRAVVKALMADHLTDATALHFAGVVTRDAGLPDDAMAYFEEALVIAPNFHYPATELAVLLSGLGDAAMAENWFTVALELAPADRRTVSAACTHAIIHGRRYEAIEILENAARAAPDEAWIGEEIARISVG